MKLKERMNGDVLILEVSGKVEGGPHSEVFRSKIAEIIEQGHKKVLIDLSDVPWMNSTGIGMIVVGMSSITNAGGTVKFLNVKERVRSILMVTRLLTVFESYYGEDEAVKSFD